MIKLAFVFRHSPYGSSANREGLDALLAATAFCHEDEIAVFFMDDGVFHLLPNQQAESILQKDLSAPLKLLDLYDINHRYVCAQSLQRFGLAQTETVISCQKIDRTLLIEQLRQAEKCLLF